MKTHLVLTVAAALAAACLLTQCAELAGLPSAPPDPALLSASKAAPFVNSLGMKFVPVPGSNVLFCTTETTVAQYQAAGLGYQAPAFPQGSNHPAVDVRWNDAKAWCKWMSAKDGHNYRLPTDAEWTAAVGPSTYPWGNQWPPPNNCGNYAGQELRGCTEAEREMFFKGQTIIKGFSDRHKFTAPVGSYAANRLGIHDLGGNAWEWCEDKKDLRGGSYFYDSREYLASSFRLAPGHLLLFGFGFRCVVVR
jgi:formylglycine-generating enzyme required for sulfatase activity